MKIREIPGLLILLVDFILVMVLLFQQLPLRSKEIFNTAAFDCTREKIMQTVTWRNWSVRIVRRAELWMGMNGGTVADFGYAVVRDSDRTFLARGNWDHYADPHGINDQLVVTELAPDYILLLPGETITLYYHCQSFGETLGQGHVIVNLWFFP